LRNLSKLGDICKAHGAYFVVDAVSILGGDELPVDKWNVDICFTATQKALAAPPGIAPISISKEAKKYMIENPPPSQYLNLKRYFKYYSDSFETPFTPAVSLFMLGEALNIIIEEEWYIELIDMKVVMLYSGLALGFAPFADADSRSNVVIAVNYLPGIDDKKFRELISTKFKVLLAGGFGELKGKVFRVGCMGEVSSYHVMRTLSAISSSM
jgi:aspartate aminotransferase-like enzyme